MLSSDWKANAFVADSEGSPRRRLYIKQERPVTPTDLPGTVSGWLFVISDVDAAGEESPHWDTWEETFEEILRYPPEYAPRSIVWRRSLTGEVVDLYSLEN